MRECECVCMCVFMHELISTHIHGRIQRLHLCRWVRPPLNECLGYSTKQSEGEVPVMLEF